MFNSVALNVVIGLVFIYLLYSLLATILSEVIATQIGLRARNLKEAINRMLNDEVKNETGWLYRLWDSLRLMKNPKNDIINRFYDHPEIKYLGSSGIFKAPSTFKATSFSKTIMSLLFGDVPMDKEMIDTKLKEIVQNAQEALKAAEEEAITEKALEKAIKAAKGVEEATKAAKEAKAEKQTKNAKKILDPETAKYIQGLWVESYGDIVKFKLQLEGWFNRTMEQALEWYRRKIRIVTFLLGFCIAWFFCADTILIIKKLSVDKDARDQIVTLANAYVQNNKTVFRGTGINSTDSLNLQKKLDTLLEVKQKLDADIANANSILGLGSLLPDSVRVIRKNNITIYIPPIDDFICKNKKTKNGRYVFSSCEKWDYFFGLLCRHFWGFLITAIAISLGAPFWFDLLNKLMKLRTSQKEPTDSASTSAPDNIISPLNREA